LASEIPVVLARHGLDAISLLDEENFPLLERPLPDLCADRIDYLLRFALHAGVVERSEARDHLEALRVMENRWVFRDYTSAFEFARLFSFVNNTHLSGFFTAVMFRTVGDALKYAMRIGAVSREELFATDEQVLNMMRQLAEKDEKMAILWRRMNKQSPVLPDFSENPETRAHLKSRAVDPLCLHHGEPVRLSRLDPEWGERVERELAPRSYGLRFA
jgi:hypothetical protein